MWNWNIWQKIFFRISLWIKTEEIEIIETISRELKEFLNLPVDIKLNFKPNINIIEKINQYNLIKLIDEKEGIFIPNITMEMIVKV